MWIIPLLCRCNLIVVISAVARSACQMPNNTFISDICKLHPEQRPEKCGLYQFSAWDGRYPYKLALKPETKRNASIYVTRAQDQAKIMSQYFAALSSHCCCANVSDSVEEMGQK